MILTAELFPISSKQILVSLLTDCAITLKRLNDYFGKWEYDLCMAQKKKRL
jgi:hypothetical protein